MKLRTQRRVIYAAMGLTMVSLIGGFALASVPLGGANASYQGSQTTTISQVKGLTWDSTNFQMANSTYLCLSSTPCNVTSAAATGCAGGIVAGHTTCAAGDWIERVTFNTTAGTAFGATVSITLYVQSGAGLATSATFSYINSNVGAQDSKQFMYLDFDVSTAGGSPATVSSVSVVVNG